MFYFFFNVFFFCVVFLFSGFFGDFLIFFPYFLGCFWSFFGFLGSLLISLKGLKSSPLPEVPKECFVAVFRAPVHGIKKQRLWRLAIIRPRLSNSSNMFQRSAACPSLQDSLGVGPSSEILRAQEPWRNRREMWLVCLSNMKHVPI